MYIMYTCIKSQSEVSVQFRKANEKSTTSQQKSSQKNRNVHRNWGIAFASHHRRAYVNRNGDRPPALDTSELLAVRSFLGALFSPREYGNRFNYSFCLNSSTEQKRSLDAARIECRKQKENTDCSQKGRREKKKADQRSFGRDVFEGRDFELVKITAWEATGLHSAPLFYRSRSNAS